MNEAITNFYIKIIILILPNIRSRIFQLLLRKASFGSTLLKINPEAIIKYNKIKYHTFIRTSNEKIIKKIQCANYFVYDLFNFSNGVSKARNIR